VRRLLVPVWVALALSGCAPKAAPPRESPPSLRASATLRNKDGQQVGVATLAEESQGLRIAVKGTGLAPGPKGVGLNVNGACDPPLFTSAGPRRHRGGTLPDLAVSTVGEGSIEMLSRDLTLSPGPDSLLDDNGTAIVIESAPYALQDDPLGTGGSRIACGVINRD
jgi:superoxide dismutase, Cu-Zn family